MANGGYYVTWDCPHGCWMMEADAPAGWTTYGQSYSLTVEWDAKETAAACVSWLEHRGCHSWGDMSFLEDMRYYASETPAQRAARKEAEALRDAQDATRVIGSKVAAKEEKWTNKGSMKFRVPRPCRYASLFEQRICAACSTKLPAGQSVCSASIVMVEEQERRRDGRMAGTGKMVARLAKPGDCGVRTCGEKLAGCWNHDQHRTCIYVHPDEPQWAAACAGSLRVKADNRLVFCMAGEEGGNVAPPTAPNRFAALMSQQRGHQSSNQQHRGGHQHHGSQQQWRQAGGGSSAAAPSVNARLPPPPPGRRQ
jgi:predicted nucleic acid-binding Zn ribbon protein